jgi:hypothetical protein
VSDDTTAAALSSSLVEYLKPPTFIGSMMVTTRRNTLVRLSKCPPAPGL